MTSNAFKAAAFTALFVFIAVFGISLLGWIVDVGAWASDKEAGQFPAVTPLAKALVAAMAAAASGLVNFIIRWAQAKGALPGEGPTYPTTQP